MEEITGSMEQGLRRKTSHRGVKAGNWLHRWNVELRVIYETARKPINEQ